MIDVSRVRYDLVAMVNNGSQVDPLHLGQAITGLGWEEPKGELSQRLTAELANQLVPRYNQWLHELVPNGAPIFLYSDWGEGLKPVFQGLAYGWRYASSAMRLSITAYDMLAQWASKDDRFYPNGMTGRAILTDLGAAWSIPFGVVEGPDVGLAKQLFHNQAIKDMVAAVLDQTRKRGGGKWTVCADQGEIHVRRPGWNTPVYHFGHDSNVQDAEENRDMEPGKFITRVLLVGAEDGDGRRPVVSRLDGRTEFGVIQDMVYQEQYDTPAAASQAAQEMMDERGKPAVTRSVVAPDLPLLRRGHKVHVTAGTLDGYYIVTAVHHDADKRTMQMEVEELAG